MEKEKIEILNQNILNKLEQIKILGGQAAFMCDCDNGTELNFANCTKVCTPPPQSGKFCA